MWSSVETIAVPMRDFVHILCKQINSIFATFIHLYIWNLNRLGNVRTVRGNRRKPESVILLDSTAGSERIRVRVRVWTTRARLAPLLSSFQGLCSVELHLQRLFIDNHGYRLEGRWSQQEDQTHSSQERECVPQASREGMFLLCKVLETKQFY